jgi:hypothetical protein
MKGSQYGRYLLRLLEEDATFEESPVAAPRIV